MSRLVEKSSWLACLAGVFWCIAMPVGAMDPAADAPPPAGLPAPPVPPVAPAAPLPVAAPTTVTLHANSLVPLRMLESLSSNTAVPGTQFRLEVTDDINVDDVVVIPAGSVAMGEVVHAAKSGMLGKAGELSVSARFVVVGERSIKLRAALGSSGKSNATVAFLFSPFIHGGQLVIPEGTEVVARIAADEIFPVPPPVH